MIADLRLIVNMLKKVKLEIQSSDMNILDSIEVNDLVEEVKSLTKALIRAYEES